MTDRLLLVARRRGGVLTSADAGALDVGPDQLATLVRRRILVRVRRDAYVLGELWRPAPPEQRLALRTRAVLRARGEGVATHQSALALHGLPVVGAPLDVGPDQLARQPRPVGQRRPSPPPDGWSG